MDDHRLVFRRIELVDNLNGGFSMSTYGMVGEPGGKAGVSLLVEGLVVRGSTANRTECTFKNGKLVAISERGCAHLVTELCVARCLK